jgi:hypothetical protein
MRAIRDRLRRADRGYVVVLAICFLALWPFISRPALPQATDAELHIFRLAELQRVVQGGELYPRWAPNFYFGLGYPIFNYYAPLVYYLGLVIAFLPGVGAVGATKAVFLAGFLGAGTGMYALVKALWGRKAGLVASVAYVYAPYVQFVDPHARGDLAEFFSLAILPWVLWSFYRLYRRATAAGWLAAVGLCAAAILAHNLMAMVTFATLLAWSLWLMLTGRPVKGESVLSRAEAWLVSGRLFWALVLGAGVSAFFWLVVGLEQDAVNLRTLVGQGGHFDFRHHFQGLSELLAFSKRIDWGATEPAHRLNLGTAQWLMGLVAITFLVVRRVTRVRLGTFFVVMALALVFMILPASRFVWESVPLLPYMQFPWRLLGPASAALAVLAGVATAGLDRLTAGRMQRWLTAGLLALFMLPGLPLTQVPPWPESFGSTSARRVLEEELAGRWLGTTATADFVPATVDVLSRPVQSVLEDYFAGRPVSRVNRATLPDEASILYEQVTPLHHRYHADSAEPFLLRLFLHHFPGWNAYIDGERVGIELGRPEGFVVVPVPAGDHEVEVVFKTTPERRLATAVSLVALLLTVLFASWLRRNPQIVTMMGEPARQEGVRSLHLELGAVLAVSLLHLFILEPTGVLRYESLGREVKPATFHTYVVFDDQIALLGFDVQDNRPTAGDSVEMTFYWRALVQPEANHQVFVHVVDGDGQLLAQSDKLNPGEFPSRRWPLDRYVRDEHRLLLPANLLQGNYEVRVGLWTAADGQRLLATHESGVEYEGGFPLPVWLAVR